MTGEVLLSTTESICPDCLAKLRAARIMRGSEVILRKECPEHGLFETPIWRGDPFFGFWQRPKTPSHPKNPFTAVEKGCPFDCGLCPEHRQQTCTVLIEVTSRCNLKCAYCFAGSGEGAEKDPEVSIIKGLYERLLEAGGPYNIQISGGEPTLREDLPEIVSIGRSMGFAFIQINTNGVRLAADRHYAKELKDAGVASIFLQFDGITDKTCKVMRGRPLTNEKKLAVKHCGEHGLGVVLVPTLVPGVNTQEIGGIIRFAIENMPTVRGVHFQPVSYFGRYPSAPSEDARITLPEIMTQIEIQTEGKIKAAHFQPPGCENALCSFHGNFVLLSNGDLKAWTCHSPDKCCSEPQLAEIGAAKARSFVSRSWAAAEPPVKTADTLSLGGWDDLLERAASHSLCISGMAFQDAWNLDLDRLRDCCIHVIQPEGGIIPFCAFNLTDSRGVHVYRERGRIAVS